MSSDQTSMVLSQETETKPSKVTISYKECGRNHAVSIGSHAVDGCREFSPTGEQGTEQGFLCEACGCHRSFHRKEVISNGRVHHAAPPPAPPSLPPVVTLGGYVTLPFVVLHPVDYNSLSQHHDPMQHWHRLALDGRDPRMEQKPNSIKRPKDGTFLK